MDIKNSDILADFLKHNQIKYVFGIIGSANSYIFDSINKLGYTTIVYVHHEQSAVMSMGAYFRASGKLSAAIVTAGAGSSNAITGVVSNWADSIPGLIISGQEQNKYMTMHKHLRMYGIQGYDSPEMVKKVTKYAKTININDDIQTELELSLKTSISGRPGPVWLDIPFDTQSKKSTFRSWNQSNIVLNKEYSIVDDDIQYLLTKLKTSKRPVLIAGHGVRISNSKNEFKQLVSKFKIPVLLSWSAIDLLPESDPFNFGRSGVMGQRSSNFIVQNADLIIVLGSRLSLLQTGYDLNDFASKAELIINDIDISEANKHKHSKIINCNTKDLISTLNSSDYTEEKSDWLSYCERMRNSYPKLLPEHNHPIYIN